MSVTVTAFTLLNLIVKLIFSNMLIYDCISYSLCLIVYYCLLLSVVAILMFLERFVR